MKGMAGVVYLSVSSKDGKVPIVVIDNPATEIPNEVVAALSRLLRGKSMAESLPDKAFDALYPQRFFVRKGGEGRFPYLLLSVEQVCGEDGCWRDAGEPWVWGGGTDADILGVVAALLEKASLQGKDYRWPRDFV